MTASYLVGDLNMSPNKSNLLKISWLSLLRKFYQNEGVTWSVSPTCINLIMNNHQDLFKKSCTFKATYEIYPKNNPEKLICRRSVDNQTRFEEKLN